MTSIQTSIDQDRGVVAALLWCKGANAGTPFDYKLWSHVRTLAGWRYALGQASLRLPDAP